MRTAALCGCARSMAAMTKSCCLDVTDGNENYLALGKQLCAWSSPIRPGIRSRRMLAVAICPEATLAMLTKSI